MWPRVIRRLGRQQPQLRSIEAHAVQVLLIGVPRRLTATGHEVDSLPRFVDANHAANQPGAVRDGMAQLSSNTVVVIEMPPAVALRVPDDVAIGEYPD